jgi:antitoxin HicB
MQTYRAKLTSASDWEPGETGFVVTFPDWGWGATQGETEMEALHKAEDALEEMIATTLTDGGELPSVPPSATLAPDERLVTVGAQMAAKAALYQTLKATGLSRAELARRLDLDEKEVRRMLDPRHPTKLARLEAGLRVLGRRLMLEVRDAA